MSQIFHRHPLVALILKTPELDVTLIIMLAFIGQVLIFQARNRTGQVGYVPEKYLQLPTTSSLLSMIQSLSSIDTQSHTSSTSTEQEPEIETLTQSSLNSHASCETTHYTIISSII